MLDTVLDLRIIEMSEVSFLPYRCLINKNIHFVVQLLSRVRLCDPMDCSMPGFSVLHCLLEFAQIYVQSFSASESFPVSWLFTSGGQNIGASPAASVLPMTIQCFGIDWLDLLAVQETLNSLLQHHSSKASVLQCSAFFMVHLSHPYMTAGKTIALTRWAFADKVMSLLFNMLSRLVITSLPRSKCLLISWLKPPSAVILEPKN